MKRLAPIFLALLLAGFGCAPAAPAPRPAPPSGSQPVPGAGSSVPGGPDLQAALTFGQPFSLAIGEGRIFSDGLQVTLLRIDDSRCKPGVQCVWAGELDPILRIQNVDKPDSTQEIRFGTTTKTQVDAAGYRFSLQDASESSATFIVSK